MSSAFIQSAVILLREGLEAMLVIAALAGYLTKAGAAHRVQALYGGALAAIVCAVVAGTKGRNPLGWGLLGLFFSIFTLIVIFVIPSKKS